MNIQEIYQSAISSANGGNTAPVDNLVGTTINARYRIDSIRGRGGIATIYQAVDLLRNEVVVIKVLSPAFRQDSYIAKKFKQEAEALRRMRHRGVVRLLGADETPDGTPYIVMEYVNGKTLHDEIRPDDMAPHRAAEILRQIGAVLHEVHKNHITHRDLKPENIMLQVEPDGELVKIVDFGIAQVQDSEVAPVTANAVPIGTLHYMSPEQLRGGERITAASDIYSMAVIAYEMITGQQPFNPTSAAHLLELQREFAEQKQNHFPADLSTNVRDVILRGLSFEAADRYQDAKEFGDDLAASLLNQRRRLRVNRVPPWQREKRLKVARRSFIVLLVLVLLSLGIQQWYAGKAFVPRSREFSYWLDVQNMRGDEVYQEPFVSFGEETFDRGDKFRFNVTAPESGYLYLFNESAPEPDAASFKMLYPTLAMNEGSASLGADQSFPTDWITFRGRPGAENFWIVWSVSPVPELEAAKLEAFKHAQGGLTEPTLAAIKEFLKTKQSGLRTYRRKTTQRVDVYGKSDVMVKLVTVEHR
jgi:serine/threonine-protein kinase